MVELSARKITWPEVGLVAEPGRYLFKFGWLNVTAADIAVWQAHPNAAFALVAMLPTGAGDEYHLGSFELRDD